MAKSVPQALFLFLSLQALTLLPLAVQAQTSSSTPDCASKLVSCANYINSTHPPDSCCSPLKETITNNLACLCAIYDNPAVLSAINITLADGEKLAQNCGIDTFNNHCKAAGPSGAISPPSAHSGTAGKKTIWTGISGFVTFLILWSIWI